MTKASLVIAKANQEKIMNLLKAKKKQKIIKRNMIKLKQDVSSYDHLLYSKLNLMIGYELRGIEVIMHQKLINDLL